MKMAILVLVVGALGALITVSFVQCLEEVERGRSRHE